jgi:hypothetical protein
VQAVLLLRPPQSPECAQALAACKRQKARLVIAKLDRASFTLSKFWWLLPQVLPAPILADR